MKAGVVTPGQKDSARVIEMAVSVPQQGEVLVKTLEGGIDGTDIEISQGHYGEAPLGLLATAYLRLQGFNTYALSTCQI